ncbi:MULTISPECIES: DUF4167 domain-containing protein [unclassified Azospirillum]|uniref:DUF4167 domain-containing protein n=1 Tax=unclassified Azospirillum TaxID=2630922 RepID=UPI000B6EB6A7|nr:MULTISPECIES: DUF4167 domain-containing protein [unclassified Azospirillum]SNT14884.1 protein of unknown function [Azospirillum sp. RU38E]SNT28011.1 protein of unknown function [Azospirillum sp. RU37A]
MRQGPNTRRSRGRGGNNGGGSNGGNGGGGGNNNGGNRRQNGPQRQQNYDSNGPDVRIRGNAFQVYDKYQALARDAQASGDRIAAENYLQHAEHYFRIMCQINEQEARQRQNNPRYDNGPAGSGPFEGEEGDDGDEVDGNEAEQEQPVA